MPRRGRQNQNAGEPVEHFRHAEARRRNNPPVGLAPTYEVRQQETRTYAYDPHLDPQLQWAGKAEHTSFEVDVVSLHIHERISTQAILRAVRRPEPAQLDLFGETPLPADQQIEFYKHEVGWANRLILGDSLLVMNSLLVKEGMAGKVQMVYIDPPYGIKYASNFQPRIDRRDVKDKDEDLTHEPEQIKAYRDTWRLGIHSYLTYLRDRLLLARELLTESGSIFVQINDENLHLVRCLLDEVFGRENFVAVIPYKTTGGAQQERAPKRTMDFLLWYSKNAQCVRFRRLYRRREIDADIFTNVELPDGSRRPVTTTEKNLAERLCEEGLCLFTTLPVHSKSPGDRQPRDFQGRTWGIPAGSWRYSADGFQRLANAERIVALQTALRTVAYFDDFAYEELTSTWADTSPELAKVYAVQTSTKVIERCILMTTDPGDLVLDPTCVRKGTGVWVSPTPSLPARGEGAISSPRLEDDGWPDPSPRLRGDYRGSDPSPRLPEDDSCPNPSPRLRGDDRGATLLPIESIQPGDYVLAHDGLLHRVLRTIRRTYRGLMVGVRHEHCERTLWLTADHKVLAHRRPHSLGGHADWSGIPKILRGRSRELRKEMTPPERMLWNALRKDGVGFTFRRQHPIGPYIADFYCREAALVVEVDGAMAHGSQEAAERDQARDDVMHALGLKVLRIPAVEVMRNLEGVCSAIREACTQQFSIEYAQWIEARELQKGDILFYGPDRIPVRITEVELEHSEEEVYDLEVEGAHSFVTEVCVVHNCGSGTTAYCAEKWGRRWITCDTSRVALAIARQRLMTARFDYYELREPERGPAGGFIYETVPHITLESIARNTEIDAIADKYQPEIDRALADLNAALDKHWKEWEVPREVPHPVWPGEAQDAYRRLLQLKRSASLSGEDQAAPLLDIVYRQTGHRWERLSDVPEPVPDEDWPEAAREALRRFWQAKRAKRKEIDESIQRNAPQETLYDRPRVVRGVVRVSGPFTVEAIPVPAVEDPTQAPIPQFEEAAEADLVSAQQGRVSDRGGDYLTTMINLLKQQGGVLFPGGKKMELQNLRPLSIGYLHAEGETGQNGKTLRVAISFGPQHGPVTAHQVQEATPVAKMNGYHVLLFAGFSFDPEAQALIQKAPVSGLQVHFASIAPDVLVGDLLKTTRASQIFTVFGQPDVRTTPSPPAGRVGEGQTYVVELLGVDIYDPLTGEVHSARGEDVAAWFLDTDYDGKTFHICQAFFPGDPDAWEKLQRALKAHIDPEVFEQMRGTVSFPFELGEHKRIAVKVIDFRGNEVVRVVTLNQRGENYGS
ncbi:hypothetical protein HRbin16_01320 [bacterium HR16]|nr:hypothetical protein HRbin16_01320 [bacterium HR16]